MAGQLYQNLLNYDHWTGDTSQESPYGQGLLDIVTNPNLLINSGAIDDFNDDQRWWMLAFLSGYENYGHVELLNQAINQWKQVTANAAGTATDQGGLAHNLTIPAGCIVAGAVYWEQTPDSNFTAISTNVSAHSSAWLYAITTEEEYLHEALAAVGWFRSEMLGSNNIMVVDALQMPQCIKDPGSLDYNTATYISTLVHLYQGTGDTNYLEWLNDTLTVSVSSVFGNDSYAPLVCKQAETVTNDVRAYVGPDNLFRGLNDPYALLVSENIYLETQALMKTFYKANYDFVEAHAKHGDAFSGNWFGELIPEGTAWATAAMLSLLEGALLAL